jgi:hypothetical protein
VGHTGDKFVTYEVMGQDITKLVNIIDSDLVNAS